MFQQSTCLTSLQVVNCRVMMRYSIYQSYDSLKKVPADLRYPIQSLNVQILYEQYIYFKKALLISYHTRNKRSLPSKCISWVIRDIICTSTLPLLLFATLNNLAFSCCYRRIAFQKITKLQFDAFQSSSLGVLWLPLLKGQVRGQSLFPFPKLYLIFINDQGGSFHPSKSSFLIYSRSTSTASSSTSSSSSSDSDSTISPCFPRNHSFPEILTSTSFFTIIFSNLYFASNSFFQAMNVSGVTGVKEANLGLSKISSFFLMTYSSSVVKAFPSTRYSCIQFLAYSTMSQTIGLLLLLIITSSIFLVMLLMLSLVNPATGQISYLRGEKGYCFEYSNIMLI